MIIRKLKRLDDINSKQLTIEQSVMLQHYIKLGYTAFIEECEDYLYGVCIKNGTRGGIKRFNKTGHDVYVKEVR